MLWIYCYLSGTREDIMSLTRAAVAQRHSPSSGYLWSNENAKAVMVLRGVWGTELLINAEWTEKAQHLSLSVMNTLLQVLAQTCPWAMPVGSPRGAWGSCWRWSWLSGVCSHCERLLLRGREFKELIAMSLFWPSPVPWPYRGSLCCPFRVGRSWKEASVSLLWDSGCSMWRWWLVLEQWSRSELCKQHLLESEDSSWGRAILGGKRGVCIYPHMAVKWPWE